MAYIDMEIDAVDLVSAQPLINTLRAMDKLEPGQVLKITTHGEKSVGTCEKLCQQLGHNLMEVVVWDDEYTLIVQKALRH